MQILDGKEVAATVRGELSLKVENFAVRHGRPPCLAVILVGDDPASHVYVKNKGIACKKVGMTSLEYKLDAQVSEAELLGLIQQLNQDVNVSGILVQLPLPHQLSEQKVLAAINPAKDPDGLTIENLGRLFASQAIISPCTPSGVIRILQHYEIPIKGRHAVVVGRSNIVGKPMAMLLQQQNATVTMCHSHTRDLSKWTRSAEIIVVAAGRPGMLGGEDFSPGSVVIDVGIHRIPTENGGMRLCGDVRFEELHSAGVEAATPVPGGVGPMTIAMLLNNTYLLAEQQLLKKN